MWSMHKVCEMRVVGPGPGIFARNIAVGPVRTHQSTEAENAK